MDKPEGASEFELKIYSSHPVEILQLPESRNIVLTGKWGSDTEDKGKLTGGCHLYDKEF